MFGISNCFSCPICLRRGSSLGGFSVINFETFPYRNTSKIIKERIIKINEIIEGKNIAKQWNAAAIIPKTTDAISNLT